MSGVGVLKILFDYFQFLSLTSNVKINWPSSWQGPLNVIRVWQVSFTKTLAALPNFPALDFRAQSVILVDILPFLCAIVLLATFRSLSSILWYFLLLASLAAFIAGVLFRTLSSTSNLLSINNAQFGNALMGASAGLFGTLIVIFLIIRFIRKRRIEMIIKNPHAFNKPVKSGNQNKVMDSSVLNSDEVLEAAMENEGSVVDFNKIQKESRYKMHHWTYLLRSAIISGSLLYLGVSLTNILQENNVIRPNMHNGYAYGSMSQWNFNGISGIVGIVLFVLGVILSIKFLVGFSLAGRKLIYKTKTLLNSNIGSISLTVLWLLYIPITSTVFSTFTCVSKTCPIGTEFPIHSYQLSADFMAKEYAGNLFNSTCLTCNFNQNTCPISNQLCPEVKDIRLFADNSISCTAEIYPYYLPGAILMLFVLTFGTPWIFYRLIKITTRFVSKIPNGIGDEDPEFSWRLQMDLSKNICQSLYYGYEYKWRYYNLIKTFQKMSIVLLFAVMVYSSNIALMFAASIIYLVYTIMAMIHLPYQTKMENALNIICFLLNAMNTVIVLLIAYEVNVPELLIWPVSALCLALPIFIVLYGMYEVARRQKEMKTYQKYDQDSVARMVSVDKNLNSQLVKYLISFFLVVGVASFLSACLKFFGYLELSSSTNVYGASNPIFVVSPSDLTNFEFAGYSNWATFTSNCCCQNMTALIFDDDNSATYEQWKCLSGSYKIRKRSSATATGLNIRPFCSNSFNSIVCGLPSYNDTLNTVVPTLCPGTTSNVTFW